MNLFAELLNKAPQYISIEEKEYNLIYLRKYNIIWEKMKKKIENPENFSLSFKDQILNWLKSLNLLERSMVLSIENDWLISVFSYMFSLTKNEHDTNSIFAIDLNYSNLNHKDKLIKRKTFFKNRFSSGIDICTFHEFMQKISYYILIEKKISDDNTNNQSSCKNNYDSFITNDDIYYYTSNNRIKTQVPSSNKKLNINNINPTKSLKGYLSFKKEDLEDLDSILRLFNSFSSGGFLEKDITIGYEQSTKGYFLHPPSWFKIDDHNSLGSWLTAYFEQSIFVKYILSNFTEDLKTIPISNVSLNKDKDMKEVKKSLSHLHSAANNIQETWKLEMELSDFIEDFNFDNLDLEGIKKYVTEGNEYRELMKSNKDRISNNTMNAYYISSCYDNFDYFPSEIRSIYLKSNKKKFVNFLFELGFYTYNTANELIVREIIKFLQSDFKNKLTEELINDFEEKEKNKSFNNKKKKANNKDKDKEKNGKFKNKEKDNKREIDNNVQVEFSNENEIDRNKKENTDSNSKLHKKEEKKQKKQKFFLFSTTPSSSFNMKEVEEEKNKDKVNENHLDSKLSTYESQNLKELISNTEGNGNIVNPNDDQSELKRPPIEDILEIKNINTTKNKIINNKSLQVYEEDNRRETTNISSQSEENIIKNSNNHNLSQKTLGSNSFNYQNMNIKINPTNNLYSNSLAQGFMCNQNYINNKNINNYNSSFQHPLQHQNLFGNTHSFSQYKNKSFNNNINFLSNPQLHNQIQHQFQGNNLNNMYNNQTNMNYSNYFLVNPMFFNINEEYFINKLSSDIFDFQMKIEQNNKILNTIKSFMVQEIENILKNSDTSFVFNKELEFLRSNIHMYSFGSLFTNLCLECSDVDILITYNNIDKLEKIKFENGIVNPDFIINSDKLIKYVIKILYDSKVFININPILTASVPIIKLKCKTELAAKKLSSSYSFSDSYNSSQSHSVTSLNYTNNMKECHNSHPNPNLYDTLQSSLSFLDFPFNKSEFSELKFDLSFMNLQKNNGNKSEVDEESKLYTQKSIVFINSTCEMHSEIRPLVLILKRLLIECKLNSYYNGGLSSYSLFYLVFAFVKYFKYKNGSIVNIGILLIELFEFYGKGFDYFRTKVDCSSLLM